MFCSKMQNLPWRDHGTFKVQPKEVRMLWTMLRSPTTTHQGRSRRNLYTMLGRGQCSQGSSRLSQRNRVAFSTTPDAGLRHKAGPS